MNLKSSTILAISTAIVLLGIGLTAAFGFWTTVSTKVPRKLSSEQLSQLDSSKSVSGSAGSQTTVASTAGQLEYNPNDIKGSYTFQEISNLYKIPLDDITSAFMVEKSAAATFKCKDLEGIFSGASNEIGTASVRMFVSYYYGLDYPLTEEVYLPETAVKILKEKSSVTSTQLVYLESHTVKK